MQTPATVALAPAACLPCLTPHRSYVFLYGVHYYMKNVHSSHYIAALLFFGYMAVVSFLFFVLTGAPPRAAAAPRPAPRSPVCRSAGFCGFVPTFLFVRAIYGAVKLD